MTILRWAARFFGLLVASLYAFVMIFEFLEGGLASSIPIWTWRDWTSLTALTVAAAAMLLAWRWELAGAALSLGALAIRTAVIRGETMQHRVTLAMAIPGILYAADWLIRRSVRT